MRRRRLLAVASVGVVTAVAGCVDSFSGMADEPDGPAYQRVLPAETDDGERTTFVHSDMQEAKEIGFVPTNPGAENPPPTSDDLSQENLSDDPAGSLLLYPLFITALTLYFTPSRIEKYGELYDRLGWYSNSSDVDTMTASSGAIVFSGSFDTDQYTDALPDSFDETENRDGFAVYEHPGQEPLEAAIRDDMVVLRIADPDESSPQSVTHLLDAESGEIDRLVNRSPDDNWILRTAGDHPFVSGVFTESVSEVSEDPLSPLSGTPLAGVGLDLLVSGASIETTNEGVTGASTDLAFTHTAQPVAESELAEAYAGSGTEVTVTVSEADQDGAQRVRISAEFSEESF